MAIGNITIYFLYIAFVFFLIPMEHNFMEKKNNVAFMNRLVGCMIFIKRCKSVTQSSPSVLH